MYGALNWFDESAAACGEMVFDLIHALGVPLTPEIATHIYLAILTDTGSFHHSNITPRTFDICRRTVEAGVNPGGDGAARLRQQQLRQAEADRRAARRDGADRRRPARGAVHGRRDAGGVRLHPQRHRRASSTCRSPRARFRRSCSSRSSPTASVRVSMRSKYDVDVRVVANEHGGGGHKNAAGLHGRRAAGSEVQARHHRSASSRPSPTGLQQRGPCR